MSVARGGVSVDDDPFAELAEIFETELQFDPRFGEDDGMAHRSAKGSPAGRGQADAELQFDAMEREFQAAFEDEAAADHRSHPLAIAPVPRYETQYRSWVSPKAAAKSPAPVRPGASNRPTHLTDEEIDDELESVLRNLSAPAKPRGHIVVETQSFAPERVAEESLPQPAHNDFDEFEELIRSELAVIRPAVAATPRRAERPAEPLAYEEAFDDGAGYADAPQAAGGQPSLPKRGFAKRKLLAGASAAALLLVGAVGIAAWPGGPATGVGDELLLIKADAQPFKVAPKDPGGRAYPNQNKAVYERVSSPDATDDRPMQKALLRNAEEPMELPVEEPDAFPDNLPGVELGESDADAAKDDTRITALTETGEASEPAIQPRKVKTVAVGPNGRLIVADAPAPAATAVPETDMAQIAALARPAASADRGTVAPSLPDPVEVAAIAQPEPMTPVAVAPIAPPAPAAVKPAPASQETSVPEPQPVQTASAMPTNGFFVQVSSQPSEAAAQQSMRSFGGRYGSVVGGRTVGIQSAEIPGKGTYYRVRVAAASKDEAATLCTKLKSAGATCFVTR